MIMSAEANKDVVRRYMQAVMDGDIATIESLQHRDVKWWVLGVGALDRARYNASVRSSLLAAERRMVRITGMTAEGDRVAYEAESEMTFPGKVYRNVYHNVVVIRDGLIVEGHEYMDTRAVQEAFG
jgi:ketosteroid isomerase-like protein